MRPSGANMIEQEKKEKWRRAGSVIFLQGGLGWGVCFLMSLRMLFDFVPWSTGIGLLGESKEVLWERAALWFGWRFLAENLLIFFLSGCVGGFVQYLTEWKSSTKRL